MKNLQTLYKECVAEAHSIGLDISSDVVEVRINSRLSRALGRCIIQHYWDGDKYVIEVQPNMLRDEVEVMMSKNVIMHELIHTCPGAFNHGQNFQRRAALVNRKLGYHVGTRESVENLEAAGVQLKRKSAKYALKCVKCGKEYPKQRWCAALETPSRYRCGVCRGELHTISLDGNVDICKPVWAR